jgi:iron complex outermembrane recepter protein
MISKTCVAVGALSWALLIGSGAAYAQEVPQTSAEDVEASDDAPITVTGSRISIPEAEIANPVTSFDSKSITLSGRTNITDLLAQAPALIGSSDSNDNAGSNASIGTTGLNLLDLRNLGTNRTLVLVDGRRHVASLPGSAAIDVNTIPTNLIERIEIVTGGASAVYGADGVSGVVNFVMKRNFDGIDARGQVGVSSRGDAGNRFFSLAAGKNFADDKANLTLSYEYSKDDRLEASQRGRLRSQNRLTLQRNPADTADDPNVPDRVFLTDIASTIVRAAAELMSTLMACLILTQMARRSIRVHLYPISSSKAAMEHRLQTILVTCCRRMNATFSMACFVTASLTRSTFSPKASM